MRRHVYIASITGSHGCHDQSDIDRAIDAAETVLVGVDHGAAYDAYFARVNEKPHDETLADVWQRAQFAAEEAFTEEWAKPDNVLLELVA